MAVYFIVGMCVLVLAVGQILFKLSAIELNQNGSQLSYRAASVFFIAMCLYGFASLAWVWALQKIELSRVYPLMSLTFILVPFLAYYFLGESVGPSFYVGAIIIAVGVCVSIWS